MRDVLPLPVYESIRDHLDGVGASAANGWKANNADEDALTGDFGRSLATQHNVEIDVNGAIWKWRIKYKKFRGRGKDAFEKTIGADGIIQIEVISESILSFNSVLFQAKKLSRAWQSEIKEQLEKMENAAPNGSAIILYSPTGYRAIKASELADLHSGLVGPIDRRMQPLGAFLDEFLECKNGLRGMYYDAVRELLLVPTIDGQLRAVPSELRHRVKIEVART